MNILLVLLLGGIGVLILWAAISYFSSRVKEPAYVVRKKANGYEVREYAPYIEARVRVSGDYREAVSAGFRILAGYIFGGNTTRASIAMTAPVLEGKTSQSIAMTAPVLDTKTGDNERVISFVMPAEYTFEALPIPNDKRVELAVVPAHTCAVLRYSGFNSSARVEQKKKELLLNLGRDKITPIGEAQSAGYNPPWTAPFMRRNEILITISP